MKRNQVSGRAYSSPQIQIICLQQEGPPVPTCSPEEVVAEPFMSIPHPRITKTATTK